MADPHRSRGIFASLAMLVAVATALATAAATLGVMWWVSRSDASAHLVRLHAEVERVFEAAIDPRFQSKADEVNRVLDRLVVIEAIRGGAIFDDSGHLQQTFGEVPDTSFQTIEHDGGAIFPARDPRRVEFYYPPGSIGTPVHLLARVEATSTTALERDSAERRVLFALVGAATAGLVAFFLAHWTVAAPLQRITGTMERIAADPGGAEADAPRIAALAEVGDLAATLERFRGALADVWRTKVAVADAILDRSPFGVLQFNAEGAATFANPAAAELFEREVVRGQTAQPLVVRDLATGSVSPLREHLLRHRGACRSVEVPSPTGQRYAVAGSLTVGADPRNAATIAMLSDVTEVHLARIDAETRFATGNARLRSARRRELELKLTLEACIALMSGPDREEEERLDALPFAVEWLAGAKEAGLAAETVVLAAEGPTVQGPVADLKAVMRLALLVSYARCGRAPADLIVDAKGINFDTAGVTIRAQPAASAEAHEEVVADWQVAFAALRTAIRKANGQLSEFTATEEGTVLRLVLRGAAERMATVKAR